MDLSKRHLDIILLLMQNEQGLSYTELAKYFEVSERTIRYDAERIQEYFDKKQISCMDKAWGQNIKLIPNDQLREHLLEVYQVDCGRYYYFSREERRQIMLFQLLNSKVPLSISYFERYFNLSKNTIMKEMDGVEKIIKQYQLKMIRKPKIGIYLEGDEVHRRHALTELILSTVEVEDVFQYMEKKSIYSKIGQVQFNALFEAYDLDVLDGLIQMAENRLSRRFTDEGYGNLIVHIGLAIKRLESGQSIEMPSQIEEDIPKSLEYQVAQEMIIKIQERFQIQVPDSEIYYVAMHLLSTKVMTGEILPEDGLREVVIQMVTAMGESYEVDLAHQQGEMIDNLIRHIRPSLYRIKYGLQIQNPMFESIYKNYNELFNKTKWVSKYLENYIGQKINDHEIAYLALHFGAGLEKLSSNPAKKARVVLVCATGVGTSQLLANQVKHYFDCEVVKTISVRDLKALDALTYDYLLSTIPLYGPKVESYLLVNAILTVSDIEKLEAHLKQKKSKKDKAIEKQVATLIDAVEQYVSLPDRAQLEYDFMYILKNALNTLKIEEKIYMLQDLILRETIRLNISATDWQEALEKATGILLERGDIEPSYLQQIYANFEKMGPYMVVAPGIVLAHARPEDGVNQIAMSLVTLAEPIPFGSELNDPVKLIITLAANDNKSHLKALSQLMNLFMNGEDLEQIMAAKDKNDVLQIIKKYSQE